MLNKEKEENIKDTSSPVSASIEKHKRDEIY